MPDRPSLSISFVFFSFCLSIFMLYVLPLGVIIDNNKRYGTVRMFSAIVVNNIILCRCYL